MPKWTEYTSKDTLADNDEVMLYDATARANKRGLMSKFWDYVVDKMSTAVISKLETNNKTIIGAINALNSKRLCMQQVYRNGVWSDCNNIPIGETAMVFNSAENKPLGNSTWFIFCMGSVKDNIKYQLAISYTVPFSVKARTYDGTTGNWLDWK